MAMDKYVIKSKKRPRADDGDSDVIAVAKPAAAAIGQQLPKPAAPAAENPKPKPAAVAEPPKKKRKKDDGACRTAQSLHRAQAKQPKQANRRNKMQQANRRKKRRRSFRIDGAKIVLG
jgi:hypothetical protein